MHCFTEQANYPGWPVGKKLVRVDKSGFLRRTMVSPQLIR